MAKVQKPGNCDYIEIFCVINKGEFRSFSVRWASETWFYDRGIWVELRLLYPYVPALNPVSVTSRPRYSFLRTQSPLRSVAFKTRGLTTRVRDMTKLWNSCFCIPLREFHLALKISIFLWKEIKLMIIIKLKENINLDEFYTSQDAILYQRLLHCAWILQSYIQATAEIWCVVVTKLHALNCRAVMSTGTKLTCIKQVSFFMHLWTISNTTFSNSLPVVEKRIIERNSEEILGPNRAL
jgi:hypothetical protein